jgi:hypothetical protein
MLLFWLLKPSHPKKKFSDAPLLAAKTKPPEKKLLLPDFH